MTNKELDQIIESLLFASSEPLSQAILNKVFDSSPPSLKESVERLNEFYSLHDRPYKIKAIAGGFQLVTNAEFDAWIGRLLGKSNKLILSSTVKLTCFTPPSTKVKTFLSFFKSCEKVLKKVKQNKIIVIRKTTHTTAYIFALFVGAGIVQGTSSSGHVRLDVLGQVRRRFQGRGHTRRRVRRRGQIPRNKPRHGLQIVATPRYRPIR